MRHHFDQYLDIKRLILDRKPELVIECGADSGENTKNLIQLRQQLPFSLIVINDGDIGSWRLDLEHLGIQWIVGISYLELAKLQDASIDFCLIDTDHNFWTLNQELTILSDKMSDHGIVVMHDTVTYARNSGHMDRYNCNTPYPAAEIAQSANMGLGMTDAIDSALKQNFHFLAFSPESHGATAIKRNVRN